MTLRTFINQWKADIFRYIKFIFGGGISLVINLILTYLLTQQFQIPFIVSFGIVLLLEILFLFVYHSFVTFKKKGEFIPFALVIIFITALNFGFVWILTNFLHLYQYLAIILSAGIISVLNYFLNKRLVFLKKEK